MSREPGLPPALDEGEALLGRGRQVEDDRVIIFLQDLVVCFCLVSGSIDFEPHCFQALFEGSGPALFFPNQEQPHEPPPSLLSRGLKPSKTGSERPTKKADVGEHPKVFDHVGLLVNGPPGSTGMPLT